MSIPAAGCQWVLLHESRRLTVVDSNAAMIFALRRFMREIDDEDAEPVTLELWNDGQLVATMLAVLPDLEDEE